MTTPAKTRTMSRSRVGVALLASALVLLMGASIGVPAAHASARCGTVSHGTNRFFGIKASGVSCTTARKMTRQWEINIERMAKACGTRICRLKVVKVRTFTCTTPRRGLDALTDCRKSGARVTWHLGLPLGHCGYTRSCGTSAPSAGNVPRV